MEEMEQDLYNMFGTKGEGGRVEKRREKDKWNVLIFSIFQLSSISSSFLYSIFISFHPNIGLIRLK